MLKFKFNHPEFSDEKLNQSIYNILDTNRLLSLATVDSEQKPHINTAYFSFNDKLHLFLITDPATKHARNIETNNSVALTVFDSHLGFWTEMQGMQLFGKCYRTPTMQIPTALGSFVKRFPVFTQLVKRPEDMFDKSLTVRFFTIEIEKIKLFDEPNFGEEVFINLTLV